MERKRNYIYPDRDSLMAAFACEFTRFLKEHSGTGRQLHIALSGGSTVPAMFGQLVMQTSRNEWSDVHLYWVDERCVPPGDPESNYGNARKALLDPLDLNMEQIHRIRGEEDPLSEAERYGKMLLRQLPLENGFPVLDWVLLGIGPDGHTASIFPRQIESFTSGSPCITSSHPVTGQRRISISGGVINEARRVSFLASGQEKAEIIRGIFLKEGRYKEYPAFYVHPVSGNLEWYLDQHAAKLL
jgi:6-phosphogluconolactonase